jgi:outer membrane protein assembly factor BamA
VGILLANAAFADAQAVGPTVSSAAGTNIPTDAVIGRVSIRIDEIFDEGDPREDGALYRLANVLHRRTREEAIAAQLLFASGDNYSQRKLDESERALRANGYLAEAVVRPAQTRGNEVDVEVRVRDVWTLTPEASFGRQGGRNKGAIALEDPNFLGFGKLVKLEHGSDFDRTTTSLGFVDPNMLGSRWRFGVQYADNSDGHQREIAVGRPFFAFDTPWSASAAYLEDDREVARYALGEEVDRVRLKHDVLRLEGGFSSGYEDGWTHRRLFGVTRDDSQFFSAKNNAGGVLPEDRNFLYPWIGWEIIEDQYAKTRNLTQIGRVEDLYLGTAARFELGYSPQRSDTPGAALFSAQARAGYAGRDPRELIQWDAEASGRWSADGLDNTLLGAGGEYFWRSNDKHVWYARLAGALAHDLDPESQLLLGGDTGLRGYPLRYQAGTASALLTFEHRWFTDWYPLRLVRVGGAAFFDIGRTWGSDAVGTPNLGWLKDVGFGLRLGNSRSSHGAVIHLDLAFPLDGTPDIDSVQFLVQTRKSF